MSSREESMKLSTATWPTLSKLLDEAFDMEPAARATWLAELMATQPQLAPSVHKLLAADDEQRDDRCTRALAQTARAIE